jgi:hypothetical protein
VTRSSIPSSRRAIPPSRATSIPCTPTAPTEGRASAFHNRLNALRWHDPDPEALHGRVQWFGFDLYYMKDAEAQETFNRSLNWFREEAP